MTNIRNVITEYFKRIDTNISGKLEDNEVKAAKYDNSIFSAILQEGMSVESFTEEFLKIYGEIETDLPANPQEWDWDVINRVLSKDEIDANRFNINTKEGMPINPELNFRSEDGKYLLKHLSFDGETFKNTPVENLPEGWNAETVIKNGKQLGQNVDKMHSIGYTGKGITVAVVDSPIIIHDDIKSSLISYQVMDDAREQELSADFHGQATSDIISGDETGVAPDSKLIYYASGNDNKTDGLQALRKIIEHNKNAEPQNKIKVVSLSWGFSEDMDGYDEFRSLVKELYDSGVFVATADFNMLDSSVTGSYLAFGCLDKKDAMADPNDFSNYIAENQFCSEPEKTIYVVSGDRTVASAKNPHSFRHDSQGSTSWSVPALAGIYTCALQCAEKNGVELTPEKFWQYALETGQPVNDSNGKFAGKAIDAEALCRYIENSAPHKNSSFGL